MQFIAGYGNADTRLESGQDYDTIDIATIWRLMQEPVDIHKLDGPWFMPSTYNGPDGRTHAVQREQGRFGALVVDIDKENPDRDAINKALDGIIGADTLAFVYATKSSTQQQKKWRLIIPTAGFPIDGKWYGPYQSALFDGLALAGLLCDRSLARAGQIIYLPNRGDHYEYWVHGETPFDPREHPHMPARAKEYFDNAELEFTSSPSRGSRMFSPRDAINNSTTLADMLIHCGYAPKGNGIDFRSPQQTTDGFATRIMNYPDGEKFVSRSQSDRDSGLGRRTAADSCKGDVFDLATHYLNGGDAEATLKQGHAILLESLGAGINAIRAILESGAACNGQRILPPSEAEIEAQRQAMIAANKQLVAAEKAGFIPELTKVGLSVRDTPLERLCLSAPGVAGAIVHGMLPYLYRGTLLPALCGALATLCMVKQGHQFGVRTDAHVRDVICPGLICIVLAPSTSGKETMKRISNTIQAELFMAGGPQVKTDIEKEYLSGGGLHKALAENPNAMVLNTEAGTILKARGADSNKESAREACISAYTTREKLEGRRGATTDATTNEATDICFSMFLATVVDGTLQEIKQNIDSGWVGRIIPLVMNQQPVAKSVECYIDEDGDEIPLKDPQQGIYRTHPWIIQRLQSYMTIEHNPDHQFHSNTSGAVYTKVTYSAKAQALLLKFSRELEETKDPEHLTPRDVIMGRAVENAQRLALVVCDGYEVTGADMRWSIDLIKAAWDEAYPQIDAAAGGDEDIDKALRKLAQMFKNGVRDQEGKLRKDFAFKPAGHKLYAVSMTCINQRLRQGLRNPKVLTEYIDANCNDEDSMFSRGPLLESGKKSAKWVWLRSDNKKDLNF